MIKIEKLSTDWSLIDGDGLVRVIPTTAYREGFVLMANVGLLAEKAQYFPEITIASDKITITIPDDDEQKAQKLAEAIDQVIANPIISSSSPEDPKDV